MSTFAVEYSYDPDRSDDMDRIRPGHRAFLRSLLEDGRLLAAGPWVGEGPGALLLIVAEDAVGVERLLDADPFQQAGLITGRRVRGWNPVIGPFADEAN